MTIFKIIIRAVSNKESVGQEYCNFPFQPILLAWRTISGWHWPSTRRSSNYWNSQVSLLTTHHTWPNFS